MRKYARKTAKKYYGKGAYSLGKAWRQSGLAKTAAAGGRAIINAAVNRAVGKISGQGLYEGYGRYTLRGRKVRNGLASGGVKDVPRFSSRNDETGMIRITKQEYVSDVFAPGGKNWELRQYRINAGEEHFKWLSGIAENYEEYSFKQLAFTFKPTITAFSSQNSVGTIIMATNYNPEAAPFKSKEEMMQYAHAVSGTSIDTVTHFVECDPKKLSGDGEYRIRHQPVNFKQSVTDYDHGNFQLGLANIASGLGTGQIGELWVSYTVELRKPRYNKALGEHIRMDYFAVQGHDQWSAGSGSLNGRYPWGTPSKLLKGQQNNLGVTSVKSLGYFATTQVNNFEAGTTESMNVANEGALRIDFHPDFSGAVEIVGVVRYGVQVAGQTGYVPTGQAYVLGRMVYLGGNISPIYDVIEHAGEGSSVGMNNQGGDPGFYRASGYAGGSSDASSYSEFHIHVSVSKKTGTADNHIIVYHNLNGTLNANPDNDQFKPYWQWAELKVSEYNAAKSGVGQGINASMFPLVTDSTGSVVLYPDPEKVKPIAGSDVA